MAMKIAEWKFVDITSKVRIMHVQHDRGIPGRLLKYTQCCRCAVYLALFMLKDLTRSIEENNIIILPGE